MTARRCQRMLLLLLLMMMLMMMMMTMMSRREPKPARASVGAEWEAPLQLAWTFEARRRKSASQARARWASSESSRATRSPSRATPASAGSRACSATRPRWALRWRRWAARAPTRASRPRLSTSQRWCRASVGAGRWRGTSATTAKTTPPRRQICSSLVPPGALWPTAWSEPGPWRWGRWRTRIATSPSRARWRRPGRPRAARWPSWPSSTGAAGATASCLCPPTARRRAPCGPATFRSPPRMSRSSAAAWCSSTTRLSRACIAIFTCGSARPRARGRAELALQPPTTKARKSQWTSSFSLTPRPRCTTSRRNSSRRCYGLRAAGGALPSWLRGRARGKCCTQ